MEAHLASKREITSQISQRLIATAKTLSNKKTPLILDLGARRTILIASQTSLAKAEGVRTTDLLLICYKARMKSLTRIAT